MSTLTQTEQTSPSVPSASQQRSYPKVGGWYRQDSAGIEYKFLDNGAVQSAAALLYVAHHFGAM